MWHHMALSIWPYAAYMKNTNESLTTLSLCTGIITEGERHKAQRLGRPCLPPD